MSRKRWIALVLGAFMALSFLTGFTPGQGREGRGVRIEQMVKKRIDKILKKIDATDEQRAEIEAVREAFFAKHRGSFPAPERGALYSMWLDPTLDAAELHKQIDEKHERRRAFLHDAADAMVQIHRILTPEQRTQVAELLKKHAHKKAHKRHGKAKQHKQHQPAGE